MELRIAYEDEHLLVVDKPAGVVVHPGPRPRDRHARPRAARARRRGRRGGSTRGSSTGSTATRPGCSSSRAPRRRTSACGSQVAERELERTYLALVRGRPALAARPDRGADRPRPHAIRCGTPSTPRRPREAVTHFEVERAASTTTRCCAFGSRRAARTRSASTWPRSTCRSRAIGVYGVPEPGLARQFLHATELAFPHPFTGERVEAQLAASARSLPPS